MWQSGVVGIEIVREKKLLENLQECFLISTMKLMNIEGVLH
jgi:hypothetical protein